MKFLTKFYPHLLAFGGFILIALIYFYPVLQGKQIYQSDIAQYTGMAKEQNDFRAAENVEPYWTNSAFGGMPTYQLGANYPHDYIGKVDNLLRFLPRPADYLFLYFLSFYVLLLVMRVSPLKAFFGALAFGLSTYLIVIIGVGHNAKAHAIGYMPLVIAGVLLVFKRRYIAGGLLTMIAAGLEINANHFQMTYYLLLLLIIISIFYIVDYIKRKEYKPLGYSLGVFVVAGILAVGVNAANLLATAEYTEFSMRGKSELTFTPDGAKNTTKSAMTYDYITEYSYGLTESFNLVVPRLFGGSRQENLGRDSELYKALINRGVPEDQAGGFSEALPLYWGDQPIVAAPAYIGAVVFFLAVLAMFIDKRKIKYAFLTGAIVSLLLSWGKNFPALTNFFIDYVPLYDRFRAVSSIQVVLELCFPVLAIMGLQSFFTKDKDLQWKALWKSGAVSLGLLAILLLLKGSFNFSSPMDVQFQEYGDDFLAALKADRRAIYSADLLRSAFLILVSGGLLWAYIKDKISQQTAVIIVGIVMIGDLFFIDKKYVKNDDQTFINRRQVEQPFQQTEADAEILKDTSMFRVYDVQGRLQARTSFFHKSVGGYSAVRPRRMDQLFDYQVNKYLDNLGKIIDPATLALNTSLPLLNALNVKYLLLETQDGTSVPVTNPFAFGNAWFVSNTKQVQSADEEMKAVGTVDLKQTAIVNTSEFRDQLKNLALANDTLSAIKVVTYKPNYLKYQSESASEKIAVFSEIYYPNGWNVYVDGKPSTHFRADYTLRAMYVPAGKHVIEFKFEPDVVKTGGTIALFSSIAMALLLFGGIYYEKRNPQKFSESASDIDF